MLALNAQPWQWNVKPSWQPWLEGPPFEGPLATETESIQIQYLTPNPSRLQKLWYTYVYITKQVSWKCEQLKNAFYWSHSYILQGKKETRFYNVIFVWYPLSAILNHADQLSLNIIHSLIDCHVCNDWPTKMILCKSQNFLGISWPVI